PHDRAPGASSRREDRPMNEQRPEASTPGVGRLEPHMSLPWVLADRLARDPAGVIFERKSSLGTEFVPVSVQTFAEEVTAVAKGLIGLGVEVGDRVAIMAHTSYEWSLLDFAAWSAGAVPVPIYETSSAEQAEWIVSNSGARVVFAETRGMAAMLQPMVERLEHLERVIVLDENAIETVIGHGADVPADRVTERSEAADMSSLATIIYTSGTTGRPKGVELTHGNFVSLVVNGSDDPNFSGVVRGPDKRTLLFMPIAHVFARFVQILCVYSGATMGHVPDAKNLVAD